MLLHAKISLQWLKRPISFIMAAILDLISMKFLVLFKNVIEHLNVLIHTKYDSSMCQYDNTVSKKAKNVIKNCRMVAILDFFIIPKKQTSAQGHTPSSRLILRNSYEPFLRSDVERMERRDSHTDRPRFKISPIYKV